MTNIAEEFLKNNPDLEKIEFIYVDFNGIPRGKYAAPKTLVKAFDGGLKMPISSYVLDVWGDNPKGTGLVMSGDGDAICRPVISSLAVSHGALARQPSALLVWKMVMERQFMQTQDKSYPQFLSVFKSLI